MYIREVKKQRSKDSKVFYQYNLVQTSRIDGKVKQRVILYLGSDKLMEDKENRRIVLSLLKGLIFKQPTLIKEQGDRKLKALAQMYYQKFCIRYNTNEQEALVSIPPAPAEAEFHNIDIKGLEVEDAREFGAEHLCKQFIDKLKLDEFLKSLGMSSEQRKLALISISSRAIYAQSEYKTSQILEINSELARLYRYDNRITHKDLYGISDLLYEHKPKMEDYLYNSVCNLFNIEDKIVIFDISNTYFETAKRGSKIAKYGRSKEKRKDCPLTVFTAVIDSRGFIRHSRTYEGNTADSTTLKDMIKDMQRYSGQQQRQTIVIDAGIATEENLEYLNSKGYKYVCVSRKRLKDYDVQISKSNHIELTDRSKNKVELQVFTPVGYTDTWMYVQSEEKRKKEESMRDKLNQFFEDELKNIESSFHKKGGTKAINKVWERIGRSRQKYKMVSGRYNINIEQKEGIAEKLHWTIKQSKIQDDKTKGVYFIRTNYENPTESDLWNIYNTIREVEATFRSLKSDMNIRPVYHQNDQRIEAHIFLTILAYQLVNSIRQTLKENELIYDWKNIVRIMSTQKIQTLKLPTDKKVIYLRKPSVPIDQARQIYKATNCLETLLPVKKYVVYH
jgi:transposase